MHSCRSPGKLVRQVREPSEGLDLNTPIMPRNFINWSCKLTPYQRERDGGGGQPPVKSEVRAQSSKVGRLWFWGVDAQEYPGGLLRLDPAFELWSLLPPDLCHGRSSSRRLPTPDILGSDLEVTITSWLLFRCQITLKMYQTILTLHR